MTSKRLLFFLFIGVVILSASYLLIKLAKGYRPDFSSRTLRPTGLLVATSNPDGAQVFVDGELESATNTTISLAPDTYTVEIKKDGFHPWKKTLKVKKELVTQTDAWLFSLVPDFRALTSTGATNPLLSPDGTKVVYQVSNSTLEKNGLWVVDLSDLPFGITRESKMIARSAPKGRNFGLATYQWSYDSKQLLVSLKTANVEENFLLETNGLTPSTQLVDITQNLTVIKKQWEKEKKLKNEQKLAKLPPSIEKTMTESAREVFFSPDENKLLYTATASATIEKIKDPSFAGASSQSEERNIKQNQTYVYDIKEDQNFFIREEKEATPKLQWFPTSKHLFLVEKDKIMVGEYENTNWTTVYAGPYEFPFVFPFPSGNKLLILTILSSEDNALPNLYAVSLQ